MAALRKPGMMGPMRREITTVEELRAIVGHPNSYVANKVGPRLSSVQQEWLRAASLGFVATVDAQGHLDVSPKGDPAGFVHIIDDRTIAIPERPGNKRVDGYLNVLQRPRVGTVFVIPGRGDTLRINGSATVLADADYFDGMAVRGKRPVLALEIRVEEVFFHCAKAFLRSGAWNPESWTPDAVPSVAQLAKTFKPDLTQAELDEYYSPDNMDKQLY
ncbi:pyridoxamine 5'-phosphate oxidase [Mycolicibacterium monacense DSM 44395]|uniref:Phosphohydrolase n=2 Tax=Mycolicibacterium monacense TaxID=85693 RepID=A0AAD1IY11_MYCMB|nr:pyridoxamine 5'-phosphate oxidase [Mycolicibacterium monacense DSM 44395]ORB22408.1 pyridoxamine 5'-phosphate oxidase [Mycolicibacterium monacense DSM 44395]BBZ62669.1 phosphohydrolase [Mycolicibacterium monacense]